MARPRRLPPISLKSKMLSIFDFPSFIQTFNVIIILLHSIVYYADIIFDNLVRIVCVVKDRHSKSYVLFPCNRSIAGWFDSEGNLVMARYFADVRSLITTTSKQGKKD